VEGIVTADGDQHVVGQDGRIEKLEGAVPGGFDGGNKAQQTGKLFAPFLTRLAKQPPQRRRAASTHH
jgi:hypothetical protein